MHASVPPKTMWNKWLIWGMINLNKRQNLFLFMNLSPFYFHHHPVHHKSSSIKVLWRYLLHWTKWQQLHDAYFAEFSYGVENEVFFPTHLFKNMRLKWKQLGSTENVHKKKGIWGMCWIFRFMRALDYTHVGDLNYFVFYEVENVGLKRDTLMCQKQQRLKGWQDEWISLSWWTSCDNRHLRSLDLPQIQPQIERTQKIWGKKNTKKLVPIQVVHIYVKRQKNGRNFFLTSLQFYIYM